MIKILHQYLKEIKFNLLASPKFFILEKQKTPDIEVAVVIDATKINRQNSEDSDSKDQLFEITLNIKTGAKVLFENNKQPEQLFELNLRYSGLFMINPADPADLDQIISIYCPTILFPFARRIVATTIGDAGLPPLLLDPIDFSKVKKQQNN